MGSEGREFVGEPHSFTLNQGDMIYIPRGFVHAAECGSGPSLHITLGLGVRTWADLLEVAIKAAALDDEGLRLTLTFSFGDDGLIDTVRAEARGRSVGERIEMTPWQGRFWNYAEHSGMKVPQDGEVAWLLPDGPRPYWRGHIESLRYELAR